MRFLAALAMTLPLHALAGGDLLEPIPGDEPAVLDELKYTILPHLQVGPEDGTPIPIVNGTTATAGEFPEVVALVMGSDRGGWQFCSGTLIAERWVLTAAHCLDEVDNYVAYGYTPYVMFGQNVYSQASITETIEFNDWIMHPEFGNSTGRLSSDIGLVELKGGSDVTPVVLNDEPPAGALFNRDGLTYVGFGITYDDGNNGGRKRWAELDYYGADSQFVYTLERESNLCSGDSGGAGFEQTDDGLELMGVNSFVFQQYTEGKSCLGGGAGATRVDQFIDWIEEYTPVKTSWEEADTDTDTDSDTDVDTDVDTDTEVGGELPENPDDAIQGGGCACDAGATPVMAWMLMMFAPLVMRRRR